MSSHIDLVHFHRKPVPGWYSLENLFADVRRELPDDIEVRVEVSRYLSQGLWPRLYNVVEAALRQGRVNHVTGDVHFLTYLMRRRRTILTITDCVPLERSGLRRWLLWLFWYWLPMRRCRVISVISEATKRELLHHVPCDAERIRVIHCTVADRFQSDPRPFDAENPRILMVGTTANKNIERTAQALEGLPCRLCIVGRLSASQRAALEEHRIDFETLERLGDEELVDQYRRADLLVFASTYEGFGMPIIEANAVGRPVVTSDLYSMPEVAGDAACLVDPFDSQSIRAGVRRVIEDDDYREQLIESGLRNAERFRPAVIAERYAELYREVASGR